MAFLREWLHRLWGYLRAGRRDSDLERELRAHLELAAEDAKASGRGRKRRGARGPAALRQSVPGDGRAARPAGLALV